MSSNIVVSPLDPTRAQAFEVVTLDILVQDTDFVGVYDLLEVWRSREGLPYEELTAAIWSPARLPKDGGDIPSTPVVGPLVNVVGEPLEFLLKERDSVQVLFTGANPITSAAAATQITSQSAGRLRSYVDADAQLVVETLEPGTGATLRVGASNAASFLALPLAEPDALAFGKDARIGLTAGVGNYHFSDVSGSLTNFYKIRFRNGSTGDVSEFSLAFSAAAPAGISPANLATGYLTLVTLDGRPLVGREVSLTSDFTGVTVEDRLLAGNALVRHTDAAGYAEFSLVRGQKYSLAIAGLNLAKEIVVPTDPTVTSFHLLASPGGGQFDYFRARVPEITDMERRHV